VRVVLTADGAGARKKPGRVTATVYTHVLSPEFSELPTVWDGLVGQDQDQDQAQ